MKNLFKEPRQPRETTNEGDTLNKKKKTIQNIQITRDRYGIISVHGLKPAQKLVRTQTGKLKIYWDRDASKQMHERNTMKWPTPSVGCSLWGAPI